MLSICVRVLDMLPRVRTKVRMAKMMIMNVQMQPQIEEFFGLATKLGLAPKMSKKSRNFVIKPPILCRQPFYSSLRFGILRREVFSIGYSLVSFRWASSVLLIMS